MTKIRTDRMQAEAALEKFRATVKDAYVNRCTPRKGSLLSYRVPAVDVSVADVPDSAVIGMTRSRFEGHSPSQRRALIVTKTYVQDPEDPLEGKTERLLLVRRGEPPMLLTDDCVEPSAPVVRNDRIALHCSREQAGDNILHAVVAFERPVRTLCASGCSPAKQLQPGADTPSTHTIDFR